MKILMCIALLSACSLVPIFSHACGAEETSEGKTEQELLMFYANKALNCETNGASITATLKIFAKYRCWISPVYGVLALGMNNTGVSKYLDNMDSVLLV